MNIMFWIAYLGSQSGILQYSAKHLLTWVSNRTLPVILPGYRTGLELTNGYVFPILQPPSAIPVSLLRSTIFWIPYPGSRVALVLTRTPYPQNYRPGIFQYRKHVRSDIPRGDLTIL